jgi:hypothetical protein
VSTILRPVGPQEPWVYWVRRVIVLAIPLILIILLAATCSGGGGGGNHGNTTGHHPSTPRATPTTPAAVAACEPSALKLKLSTDTRIYTLRQAPTLIGTFSNPGPTCRLARSASQEIWTVKSGTPTVWSTQGCPTTEHIPNGMKILQGATKVVQIVWNARLRTSSCTEGGYAQVGTYTLRATLDGVTAQNVAVFHIES